MDYTCKCLEKPGAQSISDRVRCQMTRAIDMGSQCQGVGDGGGMGELESTHTGRATQTLWGQSQSRLLATLGLTSYNSGETRRKKLILLVF